MTERTDDRGYRTIGEVIELLRGEFPDVSISKVRFLETQGLIEPSRTASGYRKFGDDDVERIRFILRDQRDRFLPLKVIRQRLEAWERGEVEAGAPFDGEPTAPGVVPGGAVASAGSDGADLALIDAAPSGVQLSLGELAGASGLSAANITELERYGLVEPRTVAGEKTYDEFALVVAKLAREFMAHGLEARHLRMFKQAVDRETELFRQAISPLTAQRSPDARRRAAQESAELVVLARKLHQALLAGWLRNQPRDGDTNVTPTNRGRR